MVRAVISGRGRIGSHMLATALQQHTRIYARTEVFGLVGMQRLRFVVSALLDKPEKEVGEDDILGYLMDYLEDQASRHGAQALVFISLYYELLSAPFTQALRRAFRERDFRIIHLTRRNLLKRLISSTVAKETGAYLAGSAQLRVRLDAERIVEDIQFTLQSEAQVRARFAGTPCLDLVYEDVCADFRGAMRQICKFLEVPYDEVQPETMKQENRTMREAIVNYDELKARFSGSRYERLFEE